MPCQTELALPSRMKPGNLARMFVANSQLASLTGCDFKGWAIQQNGLSFSLLTQQNTASGGAKSASADTRPGARQIKEIPWWRIVSAKTHEKLVNLSLVEELQLVCNGYNLRIWNVHCSGQFGIDVRNGPELDYTQSPTLCWLMLDNILHRLLSSMEMVLQLLECLIPAINTAAIKSTGV